MTRSEEHTSELQSRRDLVCRLLLEKKKTTPRLLVLVRKHQHLARLGVLHDSRQQALGEIGPGLRHRSLTAVFFFFNDTATTEIYTLSLHDALPIFTLFGLGEAGSLFAQDLAKTEV